MCDQRAWAAAPQLLSEYTMNFSVRRRSFRPNVRAAKSAAGTSAYCGMVNSSRAVPRRRYLPGSPFNVPEVENPVETFVVGDLVTHDKYGLGRVTRAEDEMMILVDFGTVRLRIPLPCAKLIKL
jgi:hypothetical protein